MEDVVEALPVTDAMVPQERLQSGDPQIPLGSQVTVMAHNQISPAKGNVFIKSLQSSQQIKIQPTQQFVRPPITPNEQSTLMMTNQLPVVSINSQQFLVPTTSQQVLSQSKQMLILQPGTALQPGGVPIQLQLAPVSPAPIPTGPRLVRLPLLVPSQPIIRPPAVRFIATAPGSPITSPGGSRLVTSRPIHVVGGPPVNRPPLQLIPNKKSIVVTSQPMKRMLGVQHQELPKLTSGIIKFSNPSLTSGNQIKVDISTAMSPLAPKGAISAVIPQKESTQVSRKLDLPDEEHDGKDNGPKEEEDDELSLECNEKFCESPDTETSRIRKASGTTAQKSNSNDQSKIKNEVKSDETFTVDLLKPLSVDETVTIISSSTIEMKTNEFGLLEFGGVSKDDKEETKVKTQIPPPSPRKDLNLARRIEDDNILCCEGCGCYGLAGEFSAQNSCSQACNRVILERMREKQRKERDLQLLKIRRDEKKSPATGGRGRKRGIQEEETMILPPEKIVRPGDFNVIYSWWDNKKGFMWPRYLESIEAKSAPVRLFLGPQPFPEPHGFTTGMKLEAIDPQHQSMICVVSVVEVQGSRLRLHIDGYGDSYDFWENADSDNMFPAGWCHKNKQILVPPKGYTSSSFSWDTYLNLTGCSAAPDQLFVGREQASVGADSAVHGWKTGMKLEAVDPNDRDMIYVTTVGNVMEGRVLLQFDGWSINHDLWTSPGGPYVHPVGWCSANKKVLFPPHGSNETPNTFSWPSYLSSTGSRAVPSWAFKSPGSTGREETEFQSGMRLEAVDRHNPQLVRVASVIELGGRQIKVHYDGWPEEYDIWYDDQSREIHPSGWCAKTGHPIMPPLTPEEVRYWSQRGGCPTPGCRGVGHVRGSKYSSHHSLAACPYSTRNIEGEEMIPDRLQGSDRERVITDMRNRVNHIKLEPLEMEDNTPMGRGNRARRKRKFFDDNKLVKMEQTSDGEIDDSRAGSSASSDSMIDVKEEEEICSKDIETQTEEVRSGGATFDTEWEERIRKTVFCPGYLPQPAPLGCLPANWVEHSKLLLGSDSERLTARRVTNWTVDQVCEFISNIPNIDHESVTNKLRSEEVDGESLLSLAQSDITAILEVKLGPAIKIYNAVTAIRLRKD